MIKENKIRKCKTCNITKQHSEFCSSPGNTDGIRIVCKSCASNAVRDSFYRKNPDKKKPESKRTPVKAPVVILGGKTVKRCNKCNTVKCSDEFYSSNSGSNGLAAYCKLCDGNIRKSNRETVRGRFNQLKCDAKRWKHHWNITFEDFEQFWKKPCTYCGVDIKTAGLDRVDTIGIYEFSNCVSCCHDCNQAKMDRTLFDFLHHVSALYHNMQSIRNTKPWHCNKNTDDCFICGMQLKDHTTPCKKIRDRAVQSKKGIRVSKEYKSERSKIYSQTPRGRYTTYKKKSIFKKIVWNLSEDDFFSMWRKDCVFCGSPIATIGVDRLDSSGAYDKLNINPVCTYCNQFKMNHSIGKFADLIERIYNHLNLR